MFELAGDGPGGLMRRAVTALVGLGLLAGCGGTVNAAVAADPRQEACVSGRLDDCMAPDLRAFECEGKGEILAAPGGKAVQTRNWSGDLDALFVGRGTPQEAMRQNEFGWFLPASAYTYDVELRGEREAIAYRRIGGRVVASAGIVQTQAGWFIRSGQDRMCGAEPAPAEVEEPIDDNLDSGVAPTTPREADGADVKRKKKRSGSLTAGDGSTGFSTSTWKSTTRRR